MVLIKSADLNCFIYGLESFRQLDSKAVKITVKPGHFYPPPHPQDTINE